MKLKSYTTKDGHELLYNGSPELNTLDSLASGPGDCWHSSFEQGYKNALSEIVYQSHVAWWYVNDFNDLDECVSWRINPNAFVIRKSLWDLFGGFDADFETLDMKGLSFGFDLIRNGGIPIYVKGLFTKNQIQFKSYSTEDLFKFFRKKFKKEHVNYLLIRQGFFKPSFWKSYLLTRNFLQDKNIPFVSPKELNPIKGNPTVSFLIPTMMRQEMTHQLLMDLNEQTYLPTTVIIVDATPKEKREMHWYDKKQFRFELLVKWQTSKGSCRARNEAIELSKDDYIIFADDDIRIQPNYIENHIRFLQTYKADACNGLDIQADNFSQGLEDLELKISKLSPERFKVGVTSSFNNANSCVLRKHVNMLGGNDINYDGGYGEDGDFGLSLVKKGITVMYNSFSRNLHLKPPAGGYRWWGSEAKILGKKRKKQPWELDTPVGIVRPVPSPTIMYQILKHFDKRAENEYTIKYFLYHFIKGKKQDIPMKIITLPWKILQYRKSKFYAKRLIELGVRH
jgi:glycosyltransferase involved in cell wall biosynthesis